jgi:hypothetical protein
MLTQQNANWVLLLLLLLLLLLVLQLLLLLPLLGHTECQQTIVGSSPGCKCASAHPH